MQRMPYISDPQLIPRVQKYLESNVDKTYVDIGLMADELQNTYKEYGRRKRSAFRGLVKKAYSIVLRSYGMADGGNASSSEEENGDSDEDEHNRPDNFANNSLNDQLVNLYARSNAAKKMDENELIDISSDDSEDAEHFSNNREKNGPSTSNRFPMEMMHNFMNDSDKSNLVKINDSVIALQGKKRKIETADVSTSKKKKKSLAPLKTPSVTLRDVAGMENIIYDICKSIVHITVPEIYQKNGCTPPRGILLHGSPGCGKTLLANAIAGQLGVPLLTVGPTELVAGVSGESEERIRDLFERALSSAPCVVFIDEIDSIASNRQHAQKEMEKRIVTQLITSFDELNGNPKAKRILLIGATNRPDSIDPALRRAGRFDKEIRVGIPDESARIEILKLLTTGMVLAPDFDWCTVAMITPGYVGADLSALSTEAAGMAEERMFDFLRKEWKKTEELAKLKKITDEKKRKADKANKDNDKTEPEIIVDDEPKDVEDLEKNDEDSPVLVIEDENSKQEDEAQSSVSGTIDANTNNVNSTESTKKETEISAEPIEESVNEKKEFMFKLIAREVPIQLQESFVITTQDFIDAAKRVQPSAKREGFATVPDVSWDDVGSLKDIREELSMAILTQIREKEICKVLDMNESTGVLLFGPPGCGKTLVAKAIANESGINFISVKGSELLNMYVGESERAVRTCFERARNSAPCVIFFDEFDSLCPKRSDSVEDTATKRVVNQMLTEMDGVEDRGKVFVLAATNRPEIIDPAMLRPGRLDQILYVGVPTENDRVEILKTITKNGTKPQLAPEVDLDVIGRSAQLNGYTGADLKNLLRKAKQMAFLDMKKQNKLFPINNQHFEQAIAKSKPSVSDKVRKHFEKLRDLYAECTNKQYEVEEMELS